MKKHRVARFIQVAFAATFAIAIASRADAAAIQIANVHVDVDDVLLTASVGALLTAQLGDVSLEGISVGELKLNGTDLDLTIGPPFVDDLPFLIELPDYSLSDGESLPDSLLFVISGLAPGAHYTGSFFIQFNTLEFTLPQNFEFETVAVKVPVPEPATMLLMASGLGATGLLERCRRRRQRTAS